MALFQRVEALEAGLTKAQADITALQAIPPGGVTPEQLATLQTQVDGIRADVGTPTV